METWNRILMSFRLSPYIYTRGYHWGGEVIRGDRLNKKNPFRWDKVVLNLPGDSIYNLTKSLTQRIASDLVTFVDDLRVIWGDYNECTNSMYRVTQIINYLGQQNA